MNAGPVNDPIRHASVAITVAFVGLSLALFLTWLSLMIFIVPGFERTFMDFRMRVPYLTELTINVSRWGVKYWYVLLIVAVPGYAVIAFVSYFLRHQTKQRLLCWLWFALIIVVPLSGQAVMLGSVLQTQSRLLDALGDPD